MMRNYNTAPKMQTATESFLRTAHQLWCTEIMDMDEYMACLNALMVIHGVRWKEYLSIEDIVRSAQLELEDAEALFVYDVNVQSTVLFHNFHHYATRYMDFTGIDFLNQNMREAV